MTEREKLIELLEEADQVAQAKGITDYKDAIADNADYLLSNGVIMPPCKVGDTVYIFNRKALGGHWEDDRYIVDGWGELKVSEIPFSLTLWECGWKDVFLTKEEAEKALKERS